MKEELLKEWEAFGAGENDGGNGLALRVLQATHKGIITSEEAEEALARGQARVFDSMWARFQAGKLFAAQRLGFMGVALMLPAERKADNDTWGALRNAATVTGKSDSVELQEMNTFCHAAVALPISMLKACTDMNGHLISVDSWSPDDADAWANRLFAHEQAFKTHPAWGKW